MTNKTIANPAVARIARQCWKKSREAARREALREIFIVLRTYVRTMVFEQQPCEARLLLKHALDLSA